MPRKRTTTITIVIDHEISNKSAQIIATALRRLVEEELKEATKRGDAYSLRQLTPGQYKAEIRKRVAPRTAGKSQNAKA